VTGRRRVFHKSHRFPGNSNFIKQFRASSFARTIPNPPCGEGLRQCWRAARSAEIAGVKTAAAQDREAVCFRSILPGANAAES
jgi:hypothetical protein